MIILANDQTTEVAQRTDTRDELWVRLDELQKATGWQLKPEGACLGELCVPLPEAKREAWIADADDWVWLHYSAFADMIGQRYVRDGDVWSVGSVPEVRPRRAGVWRRSRLRDGRAQRQHFEALRPARPQGGAVHLVILVSCRVSLPVWQELYESIGPDRFELISVAQDSGGEDAVGKWFDRASPTYRCVVDSTPGSARCSAG